MNKIKLLSSLCIILLPISVFADKKTYTWFLNKPDNALTNVAEIQHWQPEQLYDGYIERSTEPLNQTMVYAWADGEHTNNSRDKFAIIRSRGTVEHLPDDYKNRSLGYRFNNFDYIKKYIFFGGSAQEGNILAPDPWIIDEAHRAGVKIYGTVFLPEEMHGGKLSDIEALVINNNQVLHNLETIADELNFDGWFINIETPANTDDWYERTRAHEIKTKIRNFIETSNTEFITYVPHTSSPFHYGFPQITDTDINNMAYSYNNERQDVSIWWLHNRYQPNKDYLMFIDEPIFGFLKEGLYLKDTGSICEAHYQAIDNFFIGQSQGNQVWEGLKYYTKKSNYLVKNIGMTDCRDSDSGSNINHNNNGYVNIAKSSRVTNISNPYIYNIFDSNIDPNSWVEIPDNYIEIDLGYQAEINQIKLWRYYADYRRYRDVIVSVADNETHTNNTIIFNNDYDNSQGLGYGTDNEYPESEFGLSIPTTPYKNNIIATGQFIRVYANGSSTNRYNHIVELEINTHFERLNNYSSFNYLLNKQPTLGPVSNGPLATDGVLTLNPENNANSYATLRDGEQFIEYDFGQLYTLSSVNLWHAYWDARIYKDVVVATSPSPNFDHDARVIFNNDTDNSLGFGIGTDNEYPETVEGLRLTIENPFKTRYLRAYSNGSNINNANHYAEIEAYVLPTVKVDNIARAYTFYTSTATENTHRINDGDKNTHHYVDLGAGIQHVELDIGSNKTISQIMLMHYHGGHRTYNDVVVMTSLEPTFSSESRTIIFNNDKDNSLGFGYGNDEPYQETSIGKWLTLEDINARYIRFYSNGSNINEYNHLVEIEVYAY